MAKGELRALMALAEPTFPQGLPATDEPDRGRKGEFQDLEIAADPNELRSNFRLKKTESAIDGSN